VHGQRPGGIAGEAGAGLLLQPGQVERAAELAQAREVLVGEEAAAGRGMARGSVELRGELRVPTSEEAGVAVLLALQAQREARTTSNLSSSPRGRPSASRACTWPRA